MGRFAGFHPVCSFSFFMLVILFTVIFNNPVYMIISIASAFIFRFMLSGKAAFSSLKLILPVVLLAGVFNMLFTHYGITKLFTIGGHDFMLESLAFGFSTGLMLGAVILWFSCYTEIVTSEKFMALFGSFMPNLALLFSMVLRFIPLMIKTSNEIKEAHVGMGNEIHGLKNSINRFSCLVSISLEKSIETADSMKSRGFGEKKRKPYIRYKFRNSDLVLMLFLVLSAALMISADMLKINLFFYEPKMTVENNSVIFYVLFGIFSLMPVIIDVAEEIKWRLLKLKI